MSELRWIDDLEKEAATIQIFRKPEKSSDVASKEHERNNSAANRILQKETLLGEGGQKEFLPQKAEDAVQETGNRETPDEVKMVPGDVFHSFEAIQKPTDEKPEKPQTESPRKELSNKEVTDYTASLWKYLPIPENEPDPAPEYKISNLVYPGSRIIGARVRGKKHKHEGSNCDDWFETSCCEDVTFAAVSDGAGSKKFSRVGAKESCRAAVGYLINEYPKLLEAIPNLRNDLQLPLTDERCVAACGRIAVLVQQSVLQAREAVESAFYSRLINPAYADLLHRKLTLEDLSGTLLVSVIVPVRKETKEHLIVTCQVGDGMTVAINTKGSFQSSVKLLGVPDSGEFTGETEFLTSKKIKNIEELQKRTKLSLGLVDMVLMMSDGVADDYFPNETQMRRLYFDLIANGIFQPDNMSKSLSELSSEQMSLFKKIPDPISYPWVNDKTVMIPVQYANRICESMNLSLETLWEKQDILALAALEVNREASRGDDAENLNRWLDNYYARGSFDDRTLVMIEL